jgi:hypothetical protein
MLLKTDKIQLLEQVKLGVFLYVLNIHPILLPRIVCHKGDRSNCLMMIPYKSENVAT